MTAPDMSGEALAALLAQRSSIRAYTAQAVEQAAKERWAARAGMLGKEAANAVWKAMPRLHECRLQYVQSQPEGGLGIAGTTFGDNGP